MGNPESKKISESVEDLLRSSLKDLSEQDKESFDLLIKMYWL